MGDIIIITIFIIFIMPWSVWVYVLAWVLQKTEPASRLSAGIFSKDIKNRAVKVRDKGNEARKDRKPCKMTCYPAGYCFTRSHEKHNRSFRRSICLATHGFFRWATRLCGWTRPWEGGGRAQEYLFSPSHLQFPIGQSWLHGNHTSHFWVVFLSPLDGT